MDCCRLVAYYSGCVQGVGFRYTVKSLAPGFEVTGTVRNLADGRVELIAEGEREELKALLQSVRDSGLGSLIREEQVEWSQGQRVLRGFEIIS